MQVTASLAWLPAMKTVGGKIRQDSVLSLRVRVGEVGGGRTDRGCSRYVLYMCTAARMADDNDKRVRHRRQGEIKDVSRQGWLMIVIRG